MAVTDQQKIDFLLKKIGYTKTKTGSVDGTGSVSGTPKQPFAEAIASPLVVPNSSLWNEADSIPATPPGSDTQQVKVYSTTSAIRMTVDVTSSGNRAYIAYSTYNDTSSARLTNWIDTQFGSGYLIKVFKNDPTVPANALSAGATNENWFFDYSAGVLNFNDTNVPTHNDIYIVGYRYIGQTGAPTSGISTFSFLDLTVQRNLDTVGIATLGSGGSGQVFLQYQGSSKLETQSWGTRTLGTVQSLNGNVSIFKSHASNTGQLILQNSTGDAFEIGHTSSNSFITGHVGNIGINAPQVSISTDFSVGGISTFTGNIDANGDLDVDGHTNLDNLSVAGVSTFTDKIIANNNIGIGTDNPSAPLHISGADAASAMIKIEDNNNNIAASQILVQNGGRDLRISAPNDIIFTKLTGGNPPILYLENGNAVGIGTDNPGATLDVFGNTKLQNDLDVDGHTNLDNVSVAGVSTFSSSTGSIVVSEDNHPSLTFISTSSFPANRYRLKLSSGRLYLQVSANSGASYTSAVSVGGIGNIFIPDDDKVFFGTNNDAYIQHDNSNLNIINTTGNIDVTGNVVLNNDLDVSGISTFTGQVGFGTHITLQDNGEIRLGEKVSGGNRVGDFIIRHDPSLYGGAFNVIQSTNGNIQIENRDTAGPTRFMYLKSDAVQIRSYTGNESFIECTVNQDVKLYYDSSERFATTTYGALLTGGTSGIGTLAGPTTFHIDPAAVGDNTGTVVIKGNLQVDGTQTTVNSSIMNVVDKNVGIASGAANDAAADGGGITIYSGQGNKTFQFESTGSNLGSSENINIADGKVYKIGNTSVLSSNTLGSSVFDSSLTSLGSLISLTVNGNSDLNGTVAINGTATSSDLTVNGVFEVNGNSTFNGTLAVTGNTEFFSNILINDNKKLKFGTDEDLEIGHTTSNNSNFITANIGNISINAPQVSISTNFSVGGISTFSDKIKIPDNVEITLGDNDDTKIQHDTYRTIVRQHGYGPFVLDLLGDSRYFSITRSNLSEKVAEFFTNGPVDLYYDNVKRFSTSGVGATVYGNLDVTADLDVDGHTNLDNISVAGVSTFSDTVKIGTGVTALTNGNVSIGGTLEIFESSGIVNQNFSEIKLSTFSIGQHNNVGTMKIMNNNATGTLIIGAGGGGGYGGISLFNKDLNVRYLQAHNEGAVDLYYDGVKRFATTGVGATIFGNTETQTLNVTGVSTFQGVIEASAGENKIPSLYANLAALPNASTYHGMFAHVHSEGRGYFAHAGNWLELVNKDTSGNVGLSGDLDVDGHTNLDNVSIAGVVTATTFKSDSVDINGGSIDGTAIGFNNRSSGLFNNVEASGYVKSTGHMIVADHIEHGGDSDTMMKFPSSDNISFETAGSERLRISGIGSISIGSGANVQRKVDIVTGDDNGVLIRPTTAVEGSPGSSGSIQDLIQLRTPWGSSAHNTGNAGARFGIQMRAYNAAGGFDQKDPAKSAAIYAVSEDEFSGYWKNVGLAFYTSAYNQSQAEKVRIDTNGKVGIATDKPQEKLHITDSDNPKILIEDTDGSNQVGVRFKTPTQDWIAGLHGGAYSFKISKSSSFGNNDYFTIDGAGNVSIIKDFDVDGHTNLDNVSIAGVATFSSDATFNGSMTLGGTAGINGQYLKTTGNGVAWASFPTMRTKQTVTASAGQTIFNFSYNVGFLDVYVNGVKLTDAEFTATNGSAVILAVGCFVGDIVELVSFNTVSGGGGGGGTGITIQDEGSALPTSATALDFVGTGVVASGTGSTKTITINAGIAQTAVITSDAITSTELDVTGISTFSNTVDVNSDLDVDGHTELDNVNIAGVVTTSDIRSDSLEFKNAAGGQSYATFSNGGGAILKWNNTDRLETKSTGVDITGTVNATAFVGDGSGLTGITGGSGATINNNADNRLITGSNSSGTLEAEPTLTYTPSGSNNKLALTGADSYINVGANSNRFELRNNGSSSYLYHYGAGTFHIALAGSSSTIQFDSVSKTIAQFNKNAGCNFYWNNTKRLETTDGGAIVTGVCTATKFVGDGSGLTGLPGGGTGVTADSFDNTFAGTDAGISLGTNSTDNTFFGFNAGRLVNNGDGNTCLGANAGDAIQGGNNNVAVGYESIQNLIGGSENTAVGKAAGNSLTSGSDNTFVGYMAGATTNGTHNVCVGSLAGANGSGNYNVSLGHYSNWLGGSDTVAIGRYTLTRGNSQSGSIGIGYYAGYNNAADYSIYIGYESGYGLGSLPFTTGDNNVGIGYQSLYSITTGQNNTVLGRKSGYTLTTGSNNLILGNEAEPSSASISNEITFGNSAITKVRIPGINLVLDDNGATLTQGHVLTIQGNGEAKFSAPTGGGGGGGGGPDVGITTSLAGSFNAVAGNTVTIDTYSYSSNDLVFEYTVYIKNAATSEFQTQKVLASRDGTNIQFNQFGVMFSNSLIAQLSVTVSSGNINLRITPESGVSGSTDFRLKREVM